MDQDRTSVLLARYVAGEATAEELEELEWALLSNPELRKIVAALPESQRVPPKGISPDEEREMLERGLEHFRRLREKARFPEAKSPRQLPVVRRIADGAPNPNPSPASAGQTLPGISPNSATISPPPQTITPIRRKGLPYRWIAAASVLVLATGVFLYFGPGRKTSTTPIAPTVVAAKRGVRSFTELPDGSKLWLNAGSKVVFSDNFSAGKRELTLSGEAFFDVKHDELHPFIIHTGRLEVRVLGTSLNVRAYPGDSTIETTLIKGKVEVGVTGDPSSSILLHPNEKVIIPTRLAVVGSLALVGTPAKSPLPDITQSGSPVQFVRRPIVPDQTDGTITETSWVNNKLVFRKETLSGLAARLERWYDVKIVFDGHRYQGDSISGTFRDASIGDVMHALQITAGFRYHIEKDTVRIW
jgi:transmembrane sensor